MKPKKLAKILARYSGCSEEEALRRYRADKKTKRKKGKALALSTRPKRGGGNGSGGGTGSISGRHDLMAIITGDGD